MEDWNQYICGLIIYLHTYVHILYFGVQALHELCQGTCVEERDIDKQHLSMLQGLPPADVLTMVCECVVVCVCKCTCTCKYVHVCERECECMCSVYVCHLRMLQGLPPTDV